MKMTAEREEVIDFIAPYYDQTGILIGSIDISNSGLLFHSCSLRMYIIINSYSKTGATNIIIQIYDRSST